MFPARAVFGKTVENATYIKIIAITIIEIFKKAP
jgi:hypothetical protein